MVRDLHADILNQLGQSEHKLITLIDSEWGSGELNLTNFVKNINWNGREYIALGHLLGIENIEETFQLQAIDGGITISGLPDSIKALALSEEFNNRPINIYFAFLDSQDQIIDQPILVQKGFMNGLTAVDDYQGGTATIQVKYTSHLARFEDVNGRRSNPSEHKNKYPGDTFFDSVPQLTEKVLHW